MAFNPAAAFNAQFLAASQPSTPVKAESSNAVPTSHSDLTNDAIRFLNASGPLLTPGIPGFPHPINAEMAAFRAAMAQGALPFPAMYSGLHPAEMKPEMMGGAGGAVPGFFFDASLGYHPYASGLDGSRRKNATRETTAPLKSWLNEHRKNPYPTKAEKIMLALLTKMSLTQVSTWFANARRRLKKENKMTWSPRNRPGDDDDDDLADIDASERDPCERPSSSTSNLSDLGGVSVKQEVSSSELNDSGKTSESGHGATSTTTGTMGSGSSGTTSSATAEHQPPHLSSASSSAERNNHESATGTTPSVAPTVDSPRKTKIWSIADTLSSRAHAAAAAAVACGGTSEKKDFSVVSASTSAEKESNSARAPEESRVALATGAAAAATSGATANSVHMGAPPPQMMPGAMALLNSSSAGNGMMSQAQSPFLQFNPWQQQMAALNAMARMPFPRPDFLAAMAQAQAAGQLRVPPPPPMMFSPLLMGGLPTSLISSPVTPTSSHSNGVMGWCERASASPSSSTHSTTGGGRTASADRDKSC